MAMIVLLAGLLLAACGTRLTDREFTEMSQGGATQQVTDTGGTTGGDTTDGTAATTDGSAATDGSATTGGTTGGTTTGGTTTGGTTTGGTTTGGTTGGTTGASGPNQSSDVGVTPTQIVIGNITAENGVLGDAFAPAARGLRAWAAATNAKGGINGRQIVLKTCDDGEVRSKTLACAQRLVEQDHAFALVATNTRAMGGAAQYLNDKGIPVLGFPITNSFYRYPHFWSVYPFGYARDGQTVGYKGQLIGNTVIDRWFKTNLHVTKAAVFEYDIAESKQAGDSFAQGLRLEGYSVDVYTVSFAAPSFDQPVATMQSQGTQIIFDAMDDGANRKLCDAMARRQFKVQAKVSTPVSMGDAVGTTYNDTCRNSVYIPGQSFAYTSTNVPAIKAFRDAYARYQPGKPVHEWALEAWAQGQLVAEALTKMGPAPTRKGLEDYYRSLSLYTGNGIFVGLDWKPRDYAAPTGHYCTTIAHWQDSKGGWVDETGSTPFCIDDAKQYGAPALEQGN
jgi:branched-chain amino acid transport system substrate-binding protein